MCNIMACCPHLGPDLLSPLPLAVQDLMLGAQVHDMAEELRFVKKRSELRASPHCACNSAEGMSRVQENLSLLG